MDWTSLMGDKKKKNMLAKFPQISPIACGDHVIKTNENGDCLGAVLQGV